MEGFEEEILQLLRGMNDKKLQQTRDLCWKAITLRVQCCTAK